MSWYTEKIRRLRTDQGISLQNLADKAGTTKSYLSQVERGHRKPSFEIVEQIATALGASVYIQLEAPDPPQAMAPNRPRRRSIASQFLNNTE